MLKPNGNLGLPSDRSIWYIKNIINTCIEFEKMNALRFNRNFWLWWFHSIKKGFKHTWKIEDFINSSFIWTLTRKISLKPLRTSRTTFLIWGTSLKIRSGRRQRSIISSWAPDSGGMSGGSQHRKIKLTYREGIHRRRPNSDKINVNEPFNTL